MKQMKFILTVYFIQRIIQRKLINELSCVFLFHTNSWISSLYLTLVAHLYSDRPHSNCSIATRQGRDGSQWG